MTIRYLYSALGSLMIILLGAIGWFMQDMHSDVKQIRTQVTEIQVSFATMRYDMDMREDAEDLIDERLDRIENHLKQINGDY